ncbi:hypothetical protein L596_014799 [Steinernema carpocapsae]|uniref:RecF/RecN/SMC N-terminal domain-containing protein n=1 Tax=Steinernema carpocapsae TaxID=34508 RepID=A0A4U5NE63_STECR|nr:hypothetical protein L596_014799 [Steinernema carpocapsae]
MSRKRASQPGLLQESNQSLTRTPAKRPRVTVSSAASPTPAPRTPRINGSPNENVLNGTSASMYSTVESEDDEEEDIRIAGHLVSACLEDFMCHKNLKVDFCGGHNCTYIGGSNGSGKSALFAAVNLGLGGKGRSNDRGGTAGAYIREGTTRARVTLSLTNEGVGRHPKYAEEIVIKRTITPKASSYEIKSRTERGQETLVSKKKADVDEICRRFNIDLENPIVWMSQDRSRQFLQDLQPKKLFMMFMESSKLGNCYQQLAESRAEMDDIRMKMEECNDVSTLMASEYNSAVKRHEATRKIEEKNLELEDLQRVKSWIPIKEGHGKIEEGEKKIADLTVSISDLETRRERVDTVLERLQLELNSAAPPVNFSSQKQAAEEGIEDRRDARSKLLQEKTELEANYSKVNQAMKNAKRQHEIVAEQYNVMRGIDYDKQKSVEIKLQTELEQVSAEEDRHRRLHQESEANVENMRGDHEQLHRQRGELNMQTRRYKEVMDDLDREQRRSEDVRRDAELRFGRDIPKIREIIERNKHMFEKPPVGPLGSFVSVTDRKWVHVVEYILRRQLNTFLVNSGRDRKTFFDLLDRHRIGAKPTVITSRFHNARRNISGREPNERFLTVMSVLSVSNDNVYNNLVEDCQAGNILLVDSDEEARRLMSQSPPTHAQKAFTLRFGEAYPISRDKPYRFYSNSTYRAQFLTSDEVGSQRDFAAEKNIAVTRYNQSKGNLETVQRQYLQLKERLNILERDVAKHSSKANDLGERRETIASKLEELKFEVDLEALAKLEGELRDSETRLEARKEEAAQLHDKLKAMLANNAKLTQEIDDLLQEVQEYRRQENSFEREKSQKRSQIEEKRQKKVHMTARIEGITKERRQKENQLQTLREQLAQKEAELLEQQGGEKPNFSTLLPASEVDFAERKIRRQILKFQESLGGPPVTKEALREKKRKCDELKERSEKYVVLIDRLKSVFKVRYRQLQHLVAYVTLNLQTAFHKQLEKRHFNGTLEVDYTNRTLSISVQTHKQYEDQLNHSSQSHARKAQDLRGLSGGERSYSTACFVVALWECIECPFRLMDEFDVFMDMVNRKIVMDMLLSEATRKYSSYQFLFFTPQGIREIGDQFNDSVKIFRMPEVRR